MKKFVVFPTHLYIVLETRHIFKYCLLNFRHDVGKIITKEAALVKRGSECHYDEETPLNMPSENFISFEKVTKKYRSGEISVTALDEASFTIAQGEICVIVGESGAGKTTLLNILGGMDSLSGGRVIVDGEEISGYGKRRLTDYRRNKVGFVFQFYNLIPNLTALENVEIAAQLCKDSLNPMTVLEKTGLKERASNFPAQLSGGEQQRVAIARALAKNPKLLLCDEPTGALDYTTGKTIMKLLQDTCRGTGMTVIVITHNKALCAMADRVIRVKSGRIVSVECNAASTPVEEIEW